MAVELCMRAMIIGFAESRADQEVSDSAEPAKVASRVGRLLAAALKNNCAIRLHRAIGAGGGHNRTSIRLPSRGHTVQHNRVNIH
jgi:hypothetical protein